MVAHKLSESSGSSALAGGVVGGTDAVDVIRTAVEYLFVRKWRQRVEAMPEASQYSTHY